MSQPEKVGYTRKSSEGEDRQARSNAQQKAAIEGKFGEIPERLWFHDHASGRSFNRPRFQDLLTYCRTHQQTAACPGQVCIYDISRYGRIVDERTKRPNIDEMEYMRLLLKGWGWLLCFVDGPATGDPVGDAVIRSIQAQAAGQFSVTLGEKVAIGKRDWSLQGWWPGGAAPWGARRFNVLRNRVLEETRFDASGVRKRGEWGQQGATILIRDEEAAAHWEWAARRFLEGVSLAALCDELSLRCRTVHGNRWSPSALRTALTNTALIGEMRQQMKSGPQIIKKKWGPLVDADLFWRVQAEFLRRRQGRSRLRNRRGMYLLR